MMHLSQQHKCVVDGRKRKNTTTNIHYALLHFGGLLFMMMDGSHTTLYELHNYTNGMQYISLAYIFLFMSGHFWT